ncbi:MAG: phosphatase PAP2 family protein [Gemmatimonadaceae bacterium]
MDSQSAGPLKKVLRATIKRTDSLTTALGLDLIIGFLVAGTTALLFIGLAEAVQSGTTMPLDNSVLQWMAAHQSHPATAVALEITALGTGTVVIMLTAVTAMFLGLTGQRRLAVLLLVATIGGLALNLILKLQYHRQRPHIFAWDTNAVGSSFPSGHAMNAVIVYGTIAYLAAHLTRRRSGRAITQVLALFVFAAICTSRLYLGVHYPTDVLGGAVIGTAWAIFCICTLESVQRLRRDHSLT